MKKKNLMFDTVFWDGRDNHTCLSVIESFFKMDDLVTVKENLFEIMSHSSKPSVLLKNDPSSVFHFFLCLKSFLRAAYMLQAKSGKWQLKQQDEKTLYHSFGTLSVEEFKNPFLVFQNAFEEYTLYQFEYFICEAVYYALSSYASDADNGMVRPFILLLKMLDAAHLICETGIKKINRFKR